MSRQGRVPVEERRRRLGEATDDLAELATQLVEGIAAGEDTDDVSGRMIAATRRYRAAETALRRAERKQP